MNQAHKQIEDPFLRVPEFSSRKKFKGKPTIVFIDDDESLTDGIYKVVLEREGYRVITANDGQSGLDLLQKETSFPEIIFVDCSMPRMDGEAFLLELKKSLPLIFFKSKVIGFTSFDPRSPIFKKIKNLAFGCREKPFDINGILELVSGYLVPPRVVGI